MAETDKLASLTLKDLRQLAGEHQIKNRSKLAKQDLIDALSQFTGKKAKEADAGKAAPAAAEATRTEPEVLGPADVADVAPPRSRRKREDKPSRAADAEQAETNDSDDQTERADEDDGKRRRRRRRRGGRGRRGEDRDDDRSDEQADPAGESGATERASEDQTRSSSDGEQKADRSSSRRGNRESRRDGPPKPRLNGKLKPLPGVLDRLREFTVGILELCDPDTPTWAQARLSELLAATGVVATPCEGQPHPRFHEVIGTVPESDQPAGHIAVIEAPGFSLRGDRGDLFPLRKAKVRVSGNEPQDGESDETPSAAETPIEHPASDSPAPDKVVDEPEPPPAEAEAVVDEPAPTRSKARSRSRRSRRSTDQGSGDEDGSSDHSRSGSDLDAHPESTGQVVDEPEPKAAARTTRVSKADEAPNLPLEPMDAEELAERPKAEGFRPLGLNEQILADLKDIGWEEPSPIQAEAIIPALSGKDLIGQAQTGTGKTGGFVLPILHRLYEWEGEGPVALILCPTRELARQVDSEFHRMAGKSGARSALIYGGVSMDAQFRALARHPHVVIGTPGRIIDHMKRRTLDLSRLKVAVLDEADQMLDIGFLPDVEYIVKHTPPNRQTLLFSATMPDEIKRLSSRYMSEPDHIHIAPKQVTAEKVDQKYIAVDHNKKNSLLAHFIETFEPEQLVVFCKTKHQTDRVAQVLKKKNLKAQAIHGDLPQSKRERTLKDFRTGELPCLIATNVAARGLDIPSVSHVVNYDVPENPEEYVHRIGRTGRMGKIGVARTFVTPDDGQFVVEIEKHIGMLLEEEIVDGITASTATEVKRTIAETSTKGPRLLKPLVGGIRLGRRRR